MLISIKDKSIEPEKLLDAISDISRTSRFNFSVEFAGKTVIKLRNIRLKEKKRYCGNHPNACDIEGGRMGTYLEGLDWVDFNDTLNDVLDSLSVSAYVRSAVCIIRKGTRRRTVYGSFLVRHLWRPVYQWNKDEDDECYENWCGGSAPISEYPFGTPGEYTRISWERKAA